MDKFDELYKKFMNKAALVGADIRAEKLPSGPYKLIHYESMGDTLKLPPFISQIDYFAFDKCNLKRLILPNTLTSFHIRFSHNELEYINIPEKVTGIYNFTTSKKLTVCLSGCEKSIQPYAFNTCKDLTIENSHLIGRVWGQGFYFCNIHELRLIKTRIDKLGISDCKIKVLYASKFTEFEPASIKNTMIGILYYFVETQSEADEFMYDILHGSYKTSWLSRCTIEKIVPIVKPDLKEIIK